MSVAAEIRLEAGSAEGAGAAPLRLLVVDDDAVDRIAVRRALLAAGMDARIDEADDVEVAVRQLLTHSYDCILLDYYLPGSDGLAVLRKARIAGIATPVIVLTGQGDELVAVRLMKSGAADYLPKAALSPETLARSIRGALRVHEAERRAAAASAALSRYLEQLRGLAEAAIALHSAVSPDALMRTIAEQARIVVGADQAMVTVWHHAWVGPGTFVSLATACATRPPGGWVALPLITGSNENIGVIHLTHRDDGEFTAEDEAVLAQCARLAAVAVEKLLLFDAAQQAAGARERVLAIVSHDLRNPLNAIRMGAELLLETELPDDVRRRNTNAIRSAADTMNRMIEDLLDVSRIEAGRLRLVLEPVQLHETVHAVRDMLAPLVERSGVRLVCNVPPDLPLVQADRDRLLQVLSNLIWNAIKFTDRGGCVTVAVEVTDSAICCTVSDTGRGIRAADLPHVFDTFWQVEAGSRDGAGLGLPIAKGIVEAHGGAIRADSAWGEGTTFEFTIPFAARDDGAVALGRA